MENSIMVSDGLTHPYAIQPIISLNEIRNGSMVVFVNEAGGFETRSPDVNQYVGSGLMNTRTSGRFDEYYGNKTSGTSGNIESIMTSNLLLNLDAANSGSYPGTGVSWNNLAGSWPSGVLTSGPQFVSNNGGYFTFDAIDDKVYLASGSQTATSSTSLYNFASGEPYTFSMWINPSGWGTGTSTKTGRLINRVNGSLTATYLGYALSIGVNTFVSSGLSFHQYNPGNWVDYVVANSSINLNEWQNVGVTYNGVNSCVLYRNGIAIASGNVRPNPANQAQLFTIGSTYYGGLYFPGGISQVAVYNKVLSPSEMDQNYQALKSRYV